MSGNPLDKYINAMYDAFKKDILRPGMLDNIHIGHRTYYDMRAHALVHEPLPFREFYGMEIKVNPMFPYSQTCGVCGGTGEGETSTYCKECKGAGATRIEGMMTGNAYGKIILIMSKLPKKFQPCWPKDMPLPKRPLPRH